MIKTPEEAGKLWCPMTRATRHEPDDSSIANSALRAVGGCNTGGRSARVPANCRCIADQCAMWRWAPENTSVPTVTNGARTWDVAAIHERGYCGMAGRPGAA